MATLLGYIPLELLKSDFPELKSMDDHLLVDDSTSRNVLLKLSKDYDHFKRMLKVMIQNGLTIDALEACSRLKCKEWDGYVRTYFESMSFDSLWGIEERFLPSQFKHSVVMSVPLKRVEAEQLLSLKQELERNEFDPLITRSMLLVVEKNYDAAVADGLGPSEALQVLLDCREVFLRVASLEVRHFFNMDNYSKTNPGDEDDDRLEGLDMDEQLSLSPIYVDRFEENNHRGMYVDLLANLENVKRLYVDMLTGAFVDAMIQSGRACTLEHALLNKKDPRPYGDALAVDMLLAKAHESLKLLHISNCLSTVVAAIEKKESFPNLVELDVNQDARRSCFELMNCIMSPMSSTKRVPLLSRLSLKNGSLLSASLPFDEFVTAVLKLARNKISLEALTLNLRRTTLPSHREAQALLKTLGTGCGNVKTLGLVLDPPQLKQVHSIILKAFVGITTLWVYVMTDNDTIVKNSVEAALLDLGKPRKLVWNLLPSLKCVKSLNGHQRQVETWNR